MVKRKIALRNIQPPAIGATAIIDLPVGYRYHSIGFNFGYTTGSGTPTAANNITGLAEIRVVANGGNVIRRVSGKELRDMNILNGTQYDIVDNSASTVSSVDHTMNFAEPWRDSAADRDALALATRWNGGQLSSLQLQIDITTPGGTSPSAPTLTAFAIVDLAVPDRQPGVVKWIRQDITASGTSFDAKIDALGILQAIHFYPESGGSLQQSKTTVRQGDVILHELTKAQNIAFLQAAGMTPETTNRNSTTKKMTDVVFDVDDLLRSGVPLQGGPDPIITIEHASAASGSIRAVIERLDLI